MSRLIDADALRELFAETISAIAKRPEMDGNLEYMVRSSAMAIKMIDDQQTVDAVPVVHGKWVFNENDDMYYCTNCKNGSVRNDYPYCHWCGAKMDEPTQSNDSNALDALGEKVKE